MNPSSTDRIEKQVTLDASRSRVWRALTDMTQFSKWFGVNLTSPFAPGAQVTGQMAHPNYVHVTFRIWVEAMEPERFFSFRWHPHAIEKGVDYSAEPTTLVAFTLSEVEGGTLLTVVESGFDAIPVARRSTAFTGNSKGWAAQLENIRKFLAAD
jgi:uncharacterized protein YndB with AHSA1/START domain